MKTPFWLRCKFDFRYWVGQYPPLFFLLKKLFGKNLENLCSPSTELVIEGFPRSANSFAVFAFRLAQKRNVRLAHHVHVPAQIIYAAKNDIPTLVLIRKPIDVILALIVMQPWLSATVGLRAYERFYKSIRPYLNRIVIATFEETITDFGRVIRRVNQKFGTDFCEFEHSPENVKKVFFMLEERAKELKKMKGEEFKEGFAAYPSEQKESMKIMLRKELEQVSVSRLIGRCQRLYIEIIRSRDNG